MGIDLALYTNRQPQYLPSQLYMAAKFSVELIKLRFTMQCCRLLRIFPDIAIKNRAHF